MVVGTAVLFELCRTVNVGVVLYSVAGEAEIILVVGGCGVCGDDYGDLYCMFCSDDGFMGMVTP